MITDYNLLLSPIIALVFVLAITPILRQLAFKLNFTDKPNFRKSHVTPVPLIGGFVVFLGITLALFLTTKYTADFKEIIPIIIGSLVLLIMGLIDDKVNLKAIYKLIVQLALAYYVYLSGIKINSLFGIFWIDELPEIVKLILTVLVIAGTVNAFNLSDGIDGLAGGLAIIGFSAFSIIAYILNNYVLVLLFLTIVGALAGFLHYNLSKKRKIFMGDAGSLFLGFILVVSGIMLIQSSTSTTHVSKTFSTVVGVLILPVIDSIRVYRRRIKKGNSPFKADKTHLHHLLLNLKLEHKKATLIIVFTALGLLGLSIVTGIFISYTANILILLVIFAIVTRILSLNDEINEWRDKIKDLEN